MTDHSLFRISIHRIDLKTRKVTHGDVFGLPYDRLTDKTEVKAWDLSENDYRQILLKLFMGSPKWQGTDWDWSAMEYAFPFHMPAYEAGAMIAAHGVLGAIERTTEAALDLPTEITKLHVTDCETVKKGVLHYVYFEHEWGYSDNKWEEFHRAAGLELADAE